jgi:predicted negative regulator of RcsB-dependent stress response
VSAHLTEQQQIEHLKHWWKNYGISTVIIFLVVITAGLGWRYWTQHDETKLQRASTHYEVLLSAVVNDDDATTLKEANLLKDNYVHTPYAALATLMLAREDVYRKDYVSAEMQLDWVAKHANSNALKEVARLRLARILIEQNKPQDALETLTKVNDISYIPMIEEVRGDSYLALNQKDKAHTHYQLALNSIPGLATMRPILAMKLDNLATGENDK